MRGPTLLALAAVLFLSTGCDSGADPDSLYPLAPGLQWTYRVKSTPSGVATTTSTRVMTNVSRDYFAGEDNVAIRRNDDGTHYYVAQRDDGFYRIAVKLVTDHTPIMDQPAVKILPLPAKPGSQWREPAHTYMLGRARTFISEHTPDNTITLNYRIDATDAKVNVPAGKYNHCLAVVGQTTFHLGAGAGFAPSDVPIRQREWYCPGVGLTKLVRDERLVNQERTITGGRIEMTLLQGPG